MSCRWFEREVFSHTQNLVFYNRDKAHLACEGQNHTRDQPGWTSRSKFTLVFLRRHSSHFIHPFDPNLLFPLTEILLLAFKRVSVIPFPVAPSAMPCSTGITRRSWHIRIALLDYTWRKRAGRKLLKCRSLDSDFERKGMEGLLVDLILVIKRLLKISWGVLVLGEGDAERVVSVLFPTRSSA
jgi:hypothetical protein